MEWLWWLSCTYHGLSLCHQHLCKLIPGIQHGGRLRDGKHYLFSLQHGLLLALEFLHCHPLRCAPLHLYLPRCHLILLCMCVHSNLCTCWNLKLPSYYLPVAPAVAMLAAVHLSKKVGERRVGVFTALTPTFLYLSLAVLSWFIPVLLQSSGDLMVVLRQLSYSLQSSCQCSQILS